MDQPQDLKMNFEVLSRIDEPRDLRKLSGSDLNRLAQEIRDALVFVASTRPAHFASNLGVVELCIALHLVFDFSKDRLIWDTGHQIYPHKLITGRFAEFRTIRQRGGLMGYPNPEESDYDLFMTGHAGASVSTVLGLKTGDDLLGETGRRAVAVIGDGALPSGIVFEAMNNAAGLKKDLLVILNDNKMGICPRVGGLAEYLDKARTAPFYDGLKKDVSRFLKNVPVVGEPVNRSLAHFKDAVKGFLHGGMLFEEMGFRYIGPVDGHDIPALRRYLQMVKDVSGPVLLHVLTEKGHGVPEAVEDPVNYHTPKPSTVSQNGCSAHKRGEAESEEQTPAAQDTCGAAQAPEAPPFTKLVADAIFDTMNEDPRVAVLTAAMCAGNKLGRIRDTFPDRFFDTGICEGHAVAFAGGMAKAGMRPIVDIYSTFLQRSFDQIFQEVSLQNLPVVFCMDRAGLCGPDGPTHHGVFDNTYMRTFPNIVVTAPGDACDVAPLLDFALHHDAPVSIRYPKAAAATIEREAAPIELGRSEVIRSGKDGAIVVFGALLCEAVAAAKTLRDEGLDVSVINARFLRPLDTEMLRRVLSSCRFVVTVEESTLMGGFGSAVLEAANDLSLPTQHIRRLGIPDRFIEHGERSELLAELGLDASGIAAACREMARRFPLPPQAASGETAAPGTAPAETRSAFRAPPAASSE